MADFSLQATVEIDGSPLDASIEPLIEQILVDDNLHLPDMFALTLRDVDRTVVADARLKIGSKVKVAATAVGGGSPETLIVGEVTAIEAEYGAGGSRAVVRGYDPSHRFHRGRRTETYVNMKDSDIARKVAERIGVEVGTIDDSGPVLDHVSQLNATDWEFLRARAQEIGFEIAVSEGTFHFRRPAGSTGAPTGGDYASTDPLQLVFGQDLLEFLPRVTSAEQVSEVVVRGWDMKAKQNLVGRAPATASSATVKAKPAELAGLFGSPVFNLVDRPLTTQAGVEATAKAVSEQIGSGHAEAQGVARGQPRLKPGAAVGIGVVGENFEGAYVITRARHILDNGGYRTQFDVSGRQDRSILNLASGGNGSSGGSSGGKMYGLVIGLVTANDDPEGLARVKVKFPWLADDYESYWARTVAVGAGPRSGIHWIPEVDDEVLVGFEHGDIRMPYVIGGLWNGIDKPRLGDGLFDNGKVKRRGMISRAGHRVLMLDDERQSGIALISADDSVRIALKQSGVEIHVKSDGTIVIEAGTDLTIEAGANISIEAGARLTLKGGAGVTINSGGPVDIDGTPITLN